ncbi:tetratricopeptide repeat protein [Thermomicrobium sp. 4228-Ro]|uniref:tetratricopeptide repeat protein n=1 Tax=Thermomicrobium sp. 4228-Ro TaxID=2993937 RepID=UPI002249888E|nr:tetratricopeptide repeat protein [Thermomicrobium sp. 4228-Ro]MCX2726176.1 tetratricopeptide repeat protein [Thermomicrobium sp. 4228-Ro]
MLHRRWIALLALLASLALLAIITPLTTCQQHPSATDDRAVSITAVPGQLEAELRARLTAEPEDVVTLLTLAALYAHTGRLREAIPLFERVTALRPDDLVVRLSYAQALLANGYLADAEAQLRLALQLAPGNTQVFYLLGQLAERRTPPDVAAARHWYEQAARAGNDPYARSARQRLQDLGQP